MPFVERLEHLRTHRKLSRLAVAERAGLDPDYVVKIEAGQAIPRCHELEALAAALDEPLYKLFYEDGFQPYMSGLNQGPTWQELERRGAQTEQESWLGGRIKVLRSELEAWLR